MFYPIAQIDTKGLLECYELCRNSTVRSGVVGFNINVNNILAAVFIATGQDVACIGESGSAQLMLSPASREEIKSQGMYSLSQTDRLITFLLACTNGAVWFI